MLVFARTVWDEHLGRAAAQADLAARRQRKAPPGDLKEALRYEQLCEHLETQAPHIDRRDALLIDGEALKRLDACGAHHAWCTADELAQHPLSMVPAVAHALLRDGVALELRDPFVSGPTAEVAVSGEPIAPAQAWRAEANDDEALSLPARDAQRRLWASQLDRILSGEDVPLVPSGITNSVLTEGLRRAVQRGDGAPTQARVIYRDGSQAAGFALGVLDLADDSDDTLPALRFSLMSMRHPEMDPEVDGAWLRNRVISQVRPAAQTDELAYVLSRERLAELSAAGPIRLRLYQTGLEPAVVGTYRAISEQLRAAPGSLCVEPYYWRGRRGFEAGTPWRTR